MAASPPRLVVRGTAALPIPPFLWWGRGQRVPARLSFRTAYQTYPVDLFNSRTVASPHRRAAGAPVPIGEKCRNVPQFEVCFMGPVPARTEIFPSGPVARVWLRFAYAAEGRRPSCPGTQHL
jgi:hypothetical protein